MKIVKNLLSIILTLLLALCLLAAVFCVSAKPLLEKRRIETFVAAHTTLMSEVDPVIEIEVTESEYSELLTSAFDFVRVLPLLTGGGDTGDLSQDVYDFTLSIASAYMQSEVDKGTMSADIADYASRTIATYVVREMNGEMPEDHGFCDIKVKDVKVPLPVSVEQGKLLAQKLEQSITTIKGDVISTAVNGVMDSILYEKAEPEFDTQKIKTELIKTVVDTQTELGIEPSDDDKQALDGIISELFDGVLQKEDFKLVSYESIKSYIGEPAVRAIQLANEPRTLTVLLAASGVLFIVILLLNRRRLAFLLPDSLAFALAGGIGYFLQQILYNFVDVNAYITQAVQKTGLKFVEPLAAEYQTSLFLSVKGWSVYLLYAAAAAFALFIIASLLTRGKKTQNAAVPVLSASTELSSQPVETLQPAPQAAKTVSELPQDTTAAAETKADEAESEQTQVKAEVPVEAPAEAPAPEAAATEPQPKAKPKKKAAPKPKTAAKAKAETELTSGEKKTTRKAKPKETAAK